MTKKGWIDIIRIMRIILQLSLLFALTLIGEAISYMLPFPFPGTLIAMLLLLFLLASGVVKEEQLAESASFFSRYMALFFVPAGVEVIENFEALRSAWIEVAAISLISLFVTFLAAAKAVELVEWISRRKATCRNS